LNVKGLGLTDSPEASTAVDGPRVESSRLGICLGVLELFGQTRSVGVVFREYPILCLFRANLSPNPGNIRFFVYFGRT